MDNSLPVSVDLAAGCVKNGRVKWVIAVLVLFIALAYANSFSGCFVMDDQPSIVDNPTIRAGKGWGAFFAPPMGSSVGGRPVANLSLAFNYALDGLNPRGYHALNVLIHLGAALLLFGVMHKTLALRCWSEKWTAGATYLAGVVALVWALHPLQTESVTYVIQRVESLAGFFYLLTLYASIRAMETGSWRWIALACSACWLGMGTKEIVVSAPLFVLLYDRTLVAGSFSAALRSRGALYAGLFSAWVLLMLLMWIYGGHNNTTGFNAGVSPWHYLLTQCRAIVTYLGLTFWPDPLVFDYGRSVVRTPISVWPQMVLLVVLGVTTGWLMWKRLWAGLAGFWFFAILAPSSSFVPVVTQTMAEHRMYLPLAAVIVLVVVTVYHWAGRISWWAFAVVVLALGAATIARNKVYHSDIALWEDTAKKAPNNSRALNNLGNALVGAGRATEALPIFRRGLEIMKNRDADLFNNRGLALLKLGRVGEAEQDFSEAARLDPKHVRAINNLGYSLLIRGELNEAEAVIQRALAIDLGQVDAINNLGFIALKRGNEVVARNQFEKALGIMPDNAPALTNLGNMELRRGAIDMAMDLYRRAVRSDPSNAPAWYGLGNVSYAAGRWSEAAESFERSIKFDPKSADAHSNLAGSYIHLQRVQDALSAFTQAIELNPALLNARKSRATLLAQSGRLPEAVQEYERALSIAPDDFEILGNLGLAYQLTNQNDKARLTYAKALELNPANPAIRERLSALESSLRK